MSKVSYIIAICMSLIPYSAKAENYDLPVICAPIKEGLEVFKKFGEVPLFAGNDTQHEIDGLTAIVLVNKETQTYSVILISEQHDRLCAVSSGRGINIPKDKNLY